MLHIILLSFSFGFLETKRCLVIISTQTLPPWNSGITINWKKLVKSKYFLNAFWFLLSTRYSWHLHSLANRHTSQVQVLIYFRLWTFPEGMYPDYCMSVMEVLKHYFYTKLKLPEKRNPLHIQKEPKCHNTTKMSEIFTSLYQSYCRYIAILFIAYI